MIPKVYQTSVLSFSYVCFIEPPRRGGRISNSSLPLRGGSPRPQGWRSRMTTRKTCTLSLRALFWLSGRFSRPVCAIWEIWRNGSKI